MHPAHAHNTAAVQNQCSTVRDSMQSATAASRVAPSCLVRLVCNGHAVAVRYTTLSTINMSSQIPGCPAEHAPHSWPCPAEHAPHSWPTRRGLLRLYGRSSDTVANFSWSCGYTGCGMSLDAPRPRPQYCSGAESVFHSAGWYVINHSGLVHPRLNQNTVPHG